MTRHATQQPVPALPVIPIEGSGLLVAGVDFDQAPWPKHHTLELAAHHYLTEHIVPRGSSVQRAAAAIGEWMRALGPDIDITTIKREQGPRGGGAGLGRGSSPRPPAGS
jgi:hypothetical protein